MIKKFLSIAALVAVTGFAHAHTWTQAPGNNWHDSFSANGVCWIDSSNFDHGIGSEIVPTPIGGQTVRQVAERQEAFGKPERGDNPIYNDVQCGNGPANDAGDEDDHHCPGRVDRGLAGCQVKGPLWNLAEIYSSTPAVVVPVTPVQPSNPEPVPSQGVVSVSEACHATGANITVAKVRFALECPGVSDRNRDCDPIFLNGVSSTMCANYRIGSGPAHLPALSDVGSDPVVVVDPVIVPDPEPTPDPVVVSNLACEADSRSAFLLQCGIQPVDCDRDRTTGVTQCANYQLGSGAPDGVPTLAELQGNVTPIDPTDPVDPPVDPTQPRSVLAPSAAAGYALFLQTYGVPAVDCDPEAGQYRCSDNQIGSGRPGNGGSTPTDPNTDPVIVVIDGSTYTVEAESFVGSFNGTERKAWVQQSELGETGMKLEPDTRVTHDDPLIPGVNFWNAPDSSTPYMTYFVNVAEAGTYEVEIRALSKGTEDNGAHVWANGSWSVQRIQWCAGKNEWTWSERVRTAENHCGETGMNSLQLNAGSNEIRIGAREDGLFVDKFRVTHVSTGTVTLPPLGDANFYSDTFNQPYVDGDLLGAFFDSSYDPDDEQAAIFVRELLDSRPDVDYIVVNGTKKRANTGILPNSTPIMQDLFPATNFFDVHQNNNACGRPNNQTFCEDELNDIATMVQFTLNAGYRFHIAEGGPSAFTADLIRELLDRGVGNLKNIRVIQHSWGWNEQMTETADLNLIRQHASYIRIANGNNGGLTADLNSGTGDATFRQRALASQYGAQWSVAFGDINNKVDGSDAVETMWILGIPKSFAPTPNGFADRYFND